jgi:hypothetical protein
VLAFGCYKDKERVIFLVNRTSDAVQVTLPLPRKYITVMRVAPGVAAAAMQPPADVLGLGLQPYDAYRVTIQD